MKVINKKIFWDYNLNNLNFDHLDNKIWYLNRQLQFGDLSGIKKSDLKKYLPRLKIDASLKEMLTKFLIHYG